jgi:hypothetical protein
LAGVAEVRADGAHRLGGQNLRVGEELGGHWRGGGGKRGAGRGGQEIRHVAGGERRRVDEHWESRTGN